MSTQNQNSEETKKTGSEELSQEDQKTVNGGSGLLSGGNDLTNILQGTVGISNSSSGSDGDNSYTSNDSHKLDLGLGNILDNTNF